MSKIDLSIVKTTKDIPEGMYIHETYRSGFSCVTRKVDGFLRHPEGSGSAGRVVGTIREATPEEIEQYEQYRQEADRKRAAAKDRERQQAEALIPKYGFDPREVGNRPRGFWEEDGELVILARDGGGNEPDCNAGTFGKFLGSDQDGFDCTYRHYRYAPLEGDTP